MKIFLLIFGTELTVVLLVSLLIPGLSLKDMAEAIVSFCLFTSLLIPIRAEIMSIEREGNLPVLS